MTLKSIIAFLLTIFQMLQSLLPTIGSPSQNEGIEFKDICSAAIIGEYALGDENPVITIELENTSAKSNIKADMFELTELFANLEITRATQDGATITLLTEGVIPFEIPLTGGVNISEKATQASTELRAESQLIMRNAYIKQDSFTLSNGELSFTMTCLNTSSTLRVGDVVEGDGLSFTVKSVADNGAAITLAVPTEATDLDSAIAQIKGKTITIPADKLSSGTAQAVQLYANEATLGATIDHIVKAEAENTYNATAVLFVKNGSLADSLSVGDVALGGAFADSQITGLTKAQNTYTLDFTFKKSGINLNKVTLEGAVTVAEGKVKTLWGTALPQCSTELNYIRHGLSLDGYKQITAFIPAQTGTFSKIATVGSYIGTAAGIASGIYTILGMVGIVESTNAKIDDTRKIVKEVQQSIRALDKKLDKMSTAMTSGTIETLNAIQYNTYITASGNWDQFLGSYVTPLQNELTEFEMAYNDYMLNYIMNAHSIHHTITVWKDIDGNVTLPHPANGANSTWYSVDGKVLASIDAYNLVAELKNVQSKVMENGGRLYDGYWEDIIVEINDAEFERMFVDITKEEYLDAVQLNATLYALETAGAADILNAFTSLCSAIAGEGSAGGLKPIDNYLTMLSMYYNFYVESAKDIETTLTWLYSVLAEGAFISTMAYNFTPSAEQDIVNKSFDKAAEQITKASEEKNPYYSYIANKVVTASEVTQYENNSTQGLSPSHETDLYLGSCWDGNLIEPDTLKTGMYMDKVQLSLMYKRYEYLCETGVSDADSFSRYLVSVGLVDVNVLFNYLEYPKEALIVCSPISLEDIPLDNTEEMTVTRIYNSTWQKVGDVIKVGTNGDLSEEYFTSHFYRRADTMAMDGSLAENTVLLAQAHYDEDHWYWGSWATPEDWTCITIYKNPMLIFTLS